MPKGKYEGSELDGRYELLRQLDEGSFGAVYEARDRKLGRDVAIKILFDEGEAAFRKEARLAVQFEHPNVVQVYDYGADPTLNVGYIVMEFLRGRRLDQVITALACRVPDRVIMRFVDQIGSALQLAHDRQLIHRDLKPHNVMLVGEKTPQERFVLLDLGLASQVNTTSTLRNRTLDGAMSPRYASPEQLNSGDVGFRSDIYSFGTMVYELFAGTIPFPRDELLGLMMAICQDPPPPFADSVPDRVIPRGVEDVILRCLAKRPADRPASIGEVREAILQEMAATAGDWQTGSAALVGGTGTERPFSGSGVRQGTKDSFLSHTLVPPGSTASSTSHGTSLPPGSSATVDGRSDPTSGPPAASAAASKPDWKGRAPAARSSAGIAWTVVLIAAVAAGGYGLSLLDRTDRKSSSETVVPPQMRLVMAGELQLSSESSAILQLLVDPPTTADGGVPDIHVEVSGLPDWLTVAIPERITASELNQITVRAGPVAENQTSRIQVFVSAGEWTQTRDVEIRVAAPEVQALPEGFTAAPDSDILRSASDNRRHYARILRRLPSGLETAFLLIEPSRQNISGTAGGLPFYVQEDEVTNELFAAFLESASAAQLAPAVISEWRKGATAGSESLLPGEHPKLPAVRIPPLAAHQFAVWFCGPAGHLPSVDQWDLAAGLRAFQASPDPAYPDGPFRGAWDPAVTDVAVRRRSFGPKPAGTARDDVSPSGCRDLSGNVREMTETLMNGSRLGDVSEAAGTSSLQRVVLRGRSYLNEAPLRWSDLEDQSDIPDALGIDETDPSVGFRVILEIPR